MCEWDRQGNDPSKLFQVKFAEGHRSLAEPRVVTVGGLEAWMCFRNIYVNQIMFIARDYN